VPEDAEPIVHDETQEVQFPLTKLFSKIEFSAEQKDVVKSEGTGSKMRYIKFRRGLKVVDVTSCEETVVKSLKITSSLDIKCADEISFTMRNIKACLDGVELSKTHVVQKDFLDQHIPDRFECKDQCNKFFLDKADKSDVYEDFVFTWKMHRVMEDDSSKFVGSVHSCSGCLVHSKSDIVKCLYEANNNSGDPELVPREIAPKLLQSKKINFGKSSNECTQYPVGYVPAN